MRDDIFIHADSHLLTPALAPTCTIMGRGLQAFTIWHAWVLRNHESPYIVGGDFRPNDLAIGLLVCSMSQREFSSLLGDSDALAKNIGDLVSEWLGMSVEEQNQTADDVRDYIQSGTQSPEFWEPENWNPIKDRLRTPYEWGLVAMLLKDRICQSESEAWNYPFNRARCWQAVISERNGSRDYIDPKDRADIQKVNGHG